MPVVVAGVSIAPCRTICEGRVGGDADRILADQVVELVKGKGVKPSEIRVLVRTYAQLNGLEAECVDRGIPYRVVGRSPFFERRENRVLLDYIRFALKLDEPVDDVARGFPATADDQCASLRPHDLGMTRRGE